MDSSESTGARERERERERVSERVRVSESERDRARERDRERLASQTLNLSPAKSTPDEAAMTDFPCLVSAERQVQLATSKNRVWS